MVRENRDNHNSLNLSSSGSLFTALIDFDNLITPWGEELLSEEEFEYAEQLQTNSLSIYRDWSLKPDFIN